MSPDVIRTMTVLAGILLVIGALVPSQTAQIACAWMSGLFATSPLAFGSPKFKGIGMAILMGAVWLTTRANQGAGALIS
jgi:hypothetical protein